jgi:hypothetical protein
MWFFALPEAGDIVWCRFPEEAMGRPGPKPRPALVLDLGTMHGDPAVEAIFGTSQKLERLYAGEFAITPDDGIAYRVSGLSRATKFDMGKSVFLPYNDVWFGVPPGAPHGQTPKLGILHPSLMRRAQAAYAARRKR